MKTKLYIALLAIAAMAACSPEEVEYVDFDTFKVISVSNSLLVDENGQLNPELRAMEGMEAGAGTKVASIGSSALAKEFISLIKRNQVVQIAGTYTGHDIDGSPLTLSGKVVIPKDGDIKNMVLVSHFTIGANFECPSQSFPMEALAASKGYAMVFPDYIGYGVTADRIHPYLHTESTARSVVDMGLAVKAYLEHIGRKPASEEVILMGYSQGGATTMAVMDMIQNSLLKKLPIKKAYAGGGPYDLAATFDFAMQESFTGIPCAIPMIVQGINEGERIGLDLADFFGDDLLAGYDEWINSKKYTVGQINQLIGSHDLKEIMTENGRDKKSKSTAKLYKEMMMNSTLNFSPNFPVFMFHSTADDMVPFVNAKRAEEYYKERSSDITYDFDDYGSHAMAFLKFLTKVTKDLD